MDNYRKEIKQMVADVINLKLDPQTITTPSVFYSVQRILLKMGKLDLVKQMGEIAKQRLLSQGYKYYGPFGWNMESWEEMGIKQKHGYWVISDLVKYNQHISKPDKEVQLSID